MFPQLSNYLVSFVASLKNLLQRTLDLPIALAMTVNDKVTATGSPSGITAIKTLIALTRSWVVDRYPGYDFLIQAAQRMTTSVANVKAIEAIMITNRRIS
jgi:hypothetical protein